MNAKTLLAASASLALAAAPAAADQWVYDPSALTLSRGSVVLQNVTASGTSLTIGNNQSNATADDVDLSVGVDGGYSVVAISASAFQNNSTITNVVFPDSLVTIGNSAFNTCANLSCGISLPAGLSGSLQWTFRNSPVTGDVVVPDGVTGMKETFYYTKITSFRTLGTALEYIGYWGNGDGDFRNCTQLTNCVLNPGLKTIGLRVFQNCSALKDIVIPDTVENFGSSFAGCTSLTNVVMPKNLAKISSRTFSTSKPLSVWWRGYPTQNFAFGGTDTNDPMWDQSTANVLTSWIRYADKDKWEAAEAAYPDYVSLPPERPRGAAGWWKGGYARSAKTVLRWWYDPGTMVLIK